VILLGSGQATAKPFDADASQRVPSHGLPSSGGGSPPPFKRGVSDSSCNGLPKNLRANIDQALYTTKYEGRNQVPRAN